jgi:mannosyltransferase
LQSLKDKVAAAGLTERIRFPGEAPANALPDLLRSVSLVVQLPRYEGFGMVPLEAMASGTPFVASDAGHYRDFSDQERAGLIVPIENSDQAAGAVKALMSDENRFLAASLAARATVEARYGAQREADGIAEVYEQLWSEGATR